MPGNFTNQTVGKMVKHTIKKRIKAKKAKFIRRFHNTNIKGTKKLQTVTKTLEKYTNECIQIFIVLNK